MKLISDFQTAVNRLPARQARLARAAVSVVLGLAAALVLNYILYRVGLPSKPFIYVAF